MTLLPPSQIPLKQTFAVLFVVISTMSCIMGYLIIREGNISEEQRTKLVGQLITQQEQKINSDGLKIVENLNNFSLQTIPYLKAESKLQVDKAHAIARSLHHNLQPLLADKEIKLAIKEALREIRFFSGRGYLFIDEMDGTSVLLPTFPSLEGKSLYSQVDDKGVIHIRNIIKATQNENKQGYYQYRWYAPNSKEEMQDKISFMRQFEPYNWVIGTGDYMQQVETDFQQKAINQLSSLEIQKNSFFIIFDNEGKFIYQAQGLSEEFAEKLQEASSAKRFITQIENRLETKFANNDLNITKGNNTFSFTSTINHWGWTIVGGYNNKNILFAAESQLDMLKTSQQKSMQTLLFEFSLLTSLSLVIALGVALWLRNAFVNYHNHSQKQHELLLKNKSELELAARVFDSTSEGIMITNEFNQIITCNSSFCRITGYEKEEIIGLTPNTFASGLTDPEIYSDMWHSITTKGLWQGEVINQHKKGHLFPEWLSINVYKDQSGKTINYIGSIVDISKRKQAENTLQHLADYDSLTDLPNRRFFKEQIDHIIDVDKQRKPTEPINKFALLFLDLDYFKFINDSLGHSAGDKVLRIIAERLLEHKDENTIVSRLGGDEFVIVLQDISSEQAVRNFCKDLMLSIEKPMDVLGRSLIVTPSIGATLYPKDGNRTNILLKNADAALYRAKEQGRNNVQFFTTNLNRDALKRLSLENDLRRALKKKQFEIYYQPQVDLNSKQVIGCEALIRWHHPTKGFVSPIDFIPLAEETGMINEIGEWVLFEACKQAARWSEEYKRPIDMAINLSARQFNDKLVATVIKALKQSKLPSHCLTLEITESILVQDPEQVIGTLSQLRQLGIKIALDDFGTGFSSLSYLKRFPLDKLKIDRAFVKDLPNDSDDSAIIASVLAVAEHFNLTTIAEGIENTDQESLLEELNCSQGQGFYYDKPLTAHAMAQRFKHGQHGKPNLINSYEMV